VIQDECSHKLVELLRLKEIQFCNFEVILALKIPIFNFFRNGISLSNKFFCVLSLIGHIKLRASNKTSKFPLQTPQYPQIIINFLQQLLSLTIITISFLIELQHQTIIST